MDCHELHRLGSLCLIHIGKQGRMIQIIAQSHFFSGLSLEIIDRLFQFRQIVQPLFLAGIAEHLLITAFA